MRSETIIYAPDGTTVLHIENELYTPPRIIILNKDATEFDTEDRKSVKIHDIILKHGAIRRVIYLEKTI